MMKTFTNLLVGICLLVGIETLAQTSGIYVGGHFRRERNHTITDLKASGFSYVILFNVHVEANGDLTTDGETICSNGNYVFGNTQPNYVNDVNSLKQGVTSIKRVETCIGGWGNTSYTNIKNLVNGQGVGTGSILYRNFRALKNAIPSIDAINNDDEGTYDVNTATTFHVMLADIGYKTTLAPYMNKPFWQSLATNVNNQRPGTVDRIYLQWYDGGAGNNPCNWNINNIQMHTGDLYYENATNVINKMNTAKGCGSKGGFIWVYNDNNINLRQQADRINTIFGGNPVNVGEVATFYQNCDYDGKAIGLPEGNFTIAQLKSYGITDNDISSIKVLPGFQVKVFTDDNYTGASLQVNNDDNCLVNEGFNDNITSVQITAKGISGKSGTFYIRNRVSNLNMDVQGGSLNEGADLIQWNVANSNNQQFTFTEINNGIYKISGVKAGKFFDITEANPQNGTLLQQWAYLNTKNQQFILVQNNEGYYQLVARHSGKVLDVKNASTSAGGEIHQWTNLGQKNSQWILCPVSSVGIVTFYQNCEYGGYSVSLPEGVYTQKELIEKGISNDDIASVRLKEGFTIRLYQDDNQTGTSYAMTEGDNCLDNNNFSNKVSSVYIRANGTTGLNGKYYIQNRNSGQMLNIEGGNAADGTNISQLPYTGNQSHQFEFTDVGNGAYKIINLKTLDAVDVAGVDFNEGANVQSWTYTGSLNQNFILVPTSNGYYKLIARHSGKVVEVQDASKASGYNIRQWGNNGQTCAEWRLISIDNKPLVNITSPANNTVFPISPANITINANASDADLNVTKVEFYNGSQKLGEDLSSPYSFTWSGVVSGSYTITAKAYNELNIVTTSTAVNIVVNKAPVINITAPTNNTTITAGANLNITTIATDADGTISKVEFYEGANLISTATTSPFNFTWNNVKAGTYSITAKAFDNQNISTVSSVIKLTVSPITAIDNDYTMTPSKPYPNPTSDILFVGANSKIDIFTINGKLIKEMLSNDLGQIHIGDLLSDIYIIKITNEKQTYFSKIVKQ